MCCYFSPHELSYHNFHYNDILRLATKEEIKIAKDSELPIINGYKGQMDGNYIIYGANCAKFHKDFFLSLNKQYENQNRIIKEITLSSGIKISYDQIREIAEYIENRL